MQPDQPMLVPVANLLASMETTKNAAVRAAWTFNRIKVRLIICS
jgi:hypothetical protein